jgi:hypothetical protein
MLAPDRVRSTHNTGDIERDLTAQLHAFVGLLTEPPAGHVIAQLVGAAQTDAALAAALATHYTHPRRRLAVERLTRAQRLGGWSRRPRSREHPANADWLDPLKESESPSDPDPSGKCLHRSTMTEHGHNRPYIGSIHSCVCAGRRPDW